jgi:hypothetical protein
MLTSSALAHSVLGVVEGIHVRVVFRSRHLEAGLVEIVFVLQRVEKCIL